MGRRKSSLSALAGIHCSKAYRKSSGMAIPADEINIIDIGTVLLQVEISAEPRMRGNAGEYHLDEHEHHDMVHHHRKRIAAEIADGAVISGDWRQEPCNAQPECNT